MIEASGPISIAQYMGEANAHYYGTRDPLGAAGDFTTAPEISQMFGELAGLWLADMWLRSGQRGEPAYVELGPGRGTLARDALRALSQVRLEPPVHLVETSPTLRDAQSKLIYQARFHDDTDSLPDDQPLLIIANEFFDALPIRQIVKTPAGWRERVVIPRADAKGTAFTPAAGERPMDAAIPDHLRDAPEGSILESCPAAAAVALALSMRIVKQGGAALFIDYGYEGPALGDTLQALYKHQMTDPFDTVGECDLTAHVDFALLGRVALQTGARVFGTVDQGVFLTALGLNERARSLITASPHRADEIESARTRLSAADQMGSLFKVMAIVHPDWSVPEGFEGKEFL
jgi:NADH dehydrogenase [ubiquinone] 1 alpha subcomplex assembly factor 7